MTTVVYWVVEVEGSVCARCCTEELAQSLVPMFKKHFECSSVYAFERSLVVADVLSDLKHVPAVRKWFVETAKVADPVGFAEYLLLKEKFE